MATDIVIRTGLDRLRYAILFEAILVIMFSVVMVLLFDHELASMGALAITLSLIALCVTFIYNYVFDRFDVRHGRVPTQRTTGWRAVHAIGFETTLVVFSLPLIMWWLEMTFWQALMLDIATMAGVVVYTFLFTLAYDKLFPVEQVGQEDSSSP